MPPSTSHASSAWPCSLRKSDTVWWFTNALAQPAAGIVQSNQSRHLARATHLVEGGVQPERQHDLRRDRRSTHITIGRPNACVEPRKILPSHIPRPMPFRRQRLPIARPETHLPPAALQHPRKSLHLLFGPDRLLRPTYPKSIFRPEIFTNSQSSVLASRKWGVGDNTPYGTPPPCGLIVPGPKKIFSI